MRRCRKRVAVEIRKTREKFTRITVYSWQSYRLNFIFFREQRILEYVLVSYSLPPWDKREALPCLRLSPLPRDGRFSREMISKCSDKAAFSCSVIGKTRIDDATLRLINLLTSYRRLIFKLLRHSGAAGASRKRVVIFFSFATPFRFVFRVLSYFRLSGNAFTPITPHSRKIKVITVMNFCHTRNVFHPCSSPEMLDKRGRRTESIANGQYEVTLERSSWPWTGATS